MAEPVGALRVDFSANVAQFEKDMGKARKAVASFSSGTTGILKDLGGAFSSVAARINPLVAALSVATAASLAFKKSFSDLDKIAKLSDKMQISVEETQRYSHAANLAGVETQTLVGTFARLSKAIGEAAEGSKEQKEAFDSLGISIRDSNGKLISTSDIFKKLAEAFFKTGGSANFAAAASKLMGRSWAELLPMIKDGAAGVEKATQDLDRLSAVLSTDQVRAVEAANDAWTRFTTMLEGRTQRAFANLAGPIKQFLDFMTDLGSKSVFDANKLLAQNIERIANIKRILEVAATRGTAIGVGSSEKQLELLRAELQAREYTVKALRENVKEQENLNKAREAERGKDKGKLSTDRILQLQKEAEAAHKAASAVKSLFQIRESGAMRTLPQMEEEERATEDINTALERQLFMWGAINDATQKIGGEITSALESAKTPLEKLNEEMENFNNWLDMGLINTQQFEKLINKNMADVTKELQGNSEKLREEFQRPFENASRNIQGLFADTFEDIFNGATSSVEDFAASFKKIMIRVAAEVAALMIFRPQVGLAGAFGGLGIGGGMAPGVTGGFGASGGGGSIGGFGGLSGLLTGGGITLGQTNSFLLPMGVSSGVSESIGMALQNLTSLGGIFGGLAGNFGANAIFGSDRGIGSTIGGTLGAVAGSFIPIPFVGTAAGAFLGNAIGGLFGSSNKNTGRKVSAETQQSAEQNALAIFNALGVSPNIAQEGARGVGSGLVNLNEKGQPVQGSVESVFDFWVKNVLKNHSEAVIKLNQMSGVLGKVDFNNAEQAIADIQFAVNLLSADFTLTEKKVNQAEQAINQINAAFEEATKTAERLGLSTQKLNELRNKAITELTTGFNEAVDIAILRLSDPERAAFKELEQMQAARLEEAKSLGADLVDIERLSLLERKSLMEQFAVEVEEALEEVAEETSVVIDRALQSARESITGFLQGLVTSPGLTSPQSALSAAKEIFGSTLAAARGGDTEAISGLPGAGQSLIDASRAMFASGKDFFTDFNSVIKGLLPFSLDKIPGFAGGGSFTVGGFGGADSQFVPLMLSPGERVDIAPSASAEIMGDTQTGLLSALVREVTSLRNEIRKGNSESRIMAVARA